ncbi:MAG: hypothetical protein R3E02_13935 [Blastomonas sp.]
MASRPRFHFLNGLTGLALVLAIAAPVPAAAQFGGLLKPRIPKSSPSPSPSPSASEGCGKDAGSQMGRSIIGNVIGDLTGRATRNMGVPGSYLPTAEVNGILTDAIACKLDPVEQQQAANATLEATRSEEVGTTSTWTSETRENVTGSSTITQKSEFADGRRCMSVTDVVIVDGEETSVSKQMCKAPGESRYTILV